MNNNEVKDKKTEENNKQEDIDKKNKQILEELKKLEDELGENLDTEKLKKTLDKISSMSKKKSFLGGVIVFVIAFISSLVACYIAYGVIYNHIHITKLNALWLNLSISIILVIFRILLADRTSFIGKIMILVFIYGVLIIGMCALSNLGIVLEVQSFMYILLYFLVEFFVFEMLGFLLTRYQLRKIVR